MLSALSAVPFLLERGLIDSTWIIDGDLTIRSLARRNRNLRVEGPGGTGFLIKQPDREAKDARETLRAEAAFQRFCRLEPAVAELLRMVPRLLVDDAENAVLVFELIPGAASLWSLSEADQGQALTARASRALGHAIGTLHSIFRLTTRERDPRLAWLSRAMPWVMKLNKPGPDMLADSSGANHQMLRVLQTHGGSAGRLDRLSGLWRPETVIHSDIKFDNVLVRPERSTQEPASPELWITDWEMVRFGDPAWDLAGALQDFLVLWVSSMPLSDDLTTEETIIRARIPLAALRSAIRALWSGYREGAGLEPSQADDFLLRAVAFSAARLIQSACELSHRADRLAGQSVVLLQISANLLAEPELGQVQLYGIPLGSLAQ